MPVLTATNAPVRVLALQRAESLPSAPLRQWISRVGRGQPGGHCMAWVLYERTHYMRRSAWTIGVALLAALSLGVAACGGERRRQRRPRAAPTTGHATPTESASTGGKLTVLWAGDVDYIDCGQTYYQMGYFICYATQSRCTRTSPTTAPTWCRTSPRRCPRSPRTARPSRSRSSRASSSRRRYDREVTSKDVKYAIERGFFSSVATGSRVLLRGHRRRRGRRRSPARRSRASRRRTTRRSSSSSQGDGRRDGRRRARPTARPRRCRRSTPRSSTRRRRRPTARTRSRPART